MLLSLLFLTPNTNHHNDTNIVSTVGIASIDIANAISNDSIGGNIGILKNSCHTNRGVCLILFSLWLLLLFLRILLQLSPSRLPFTIIICININCIWLCVDLRIYLRAYTFI